MFSCSTLTEAQVTLWVEDISVSLSALPIFLGTAHGSNLLETILPVLMSSTVLTQFKLQGVSKLEKLAVPVSTVLLHYVPLGTTAALPLHLLTSTVVVTPLWLMRTGRP